MSIRITEDSVVNYENSPDVNRKLFPNLNICGKAIDELAEEIDGKAPAIFSEASGSTATFDDGADGMPMKSCIVNFEPIQEGEGDPSAENVRPISGRTGLTVYHSGADTSDPSTISVNWETETGTVYGGYVDVVSGELVIDRVLLTVTAEDVTDVSVTSSGVPAATLFQSSLSWVKLNSTIVCDKYKPYSGQVETGTIRLTPQNSRAIVYDYRFSSLDVAKELLSGTQICLELSVPTENQLTPQEVRTFLGVNNIWSDAGDVSVDYPADTKTYIDDLSIKTVEVSGQTPNITAEENTRYICGEVTSLTFTPSEKGICDVRFTAASISTVLTLPETVKFPEWFDPTLLEAGTTYEINIVDGIYGAVMSWA